MRKKERQVSIYSLKLFSKFALFLGHKAGNMVSRRARKNVHLSAEEKRRGRKVAGKSSQAKGTSTRTKPNKTAVEIIKKMKA